MKHLIISYVMTRLKEPSTWRGIILLITSIGISLSPEQLDAFVALGLCLTGAIGTFLPDAKK